MATLVLGTVGRVFGGPVGLLVGTLIGRSIDGEIFKGKGSGGPRLTDLAVQTSSYGSAIPQVFGTMRMAGTVIWSTDLIETRTSSHRKGQPTTTTYSYSASFAVLLSGRRVTGVGRIWADGNLLRGAAGDFKTPCQFRLHAGDEDQPPDPLIASIEGAATPAHRGCAYAVFENLELGDFGNRIPSLTFELIADPAPVTAGAIAAALAGEAIVDDGVAMAIDGFAAEGSARSVVALLATASGARFRPDGGRLRMTDAADAGATIGDDGFAPDGRQGARSRRTFAAAETTPKTLSVAHYDPARDYQIGVQQARRPGAGVRDDRVALPAAVSAARAKALATRLLATAEAEREQRTVALAVEAAHLAPGALVAIDGEAGAWRVTEVALEGMVTTLMLKRIAVATAGASGASSGRVLPAPDVIAGATLLRIAELPSLGDSPLAAPRLSIVAAGTEPGWRGAALLYSLDGGDSWRDAGATAAPGVIGRIAISPGTAPSALIDESDTIEVVLARADMTLADADDTSLDHGGNLALVGDELIQFGRAQPLGDARWRLSRLWRGRRGTEGAIGGQAAGDGFVLLSPDSVAAIDLPVAALGSTVDVMASGIGDGDSPPAASCRINGRSVAPPSPVLLKVDRTGDDATARWTRRSRAGFRWIDGGDAPLAEEAERYRVTITPLVGAARTVTTELPEATLLPGEAAAGTMIVVHQLGSLAESAPATLLLS